MDKQFPPSSMYCPHCNAKYEVVRVEAPTTHDRQVTCLSCGGPLAAREGAFILKYFRVDRPSMTARMRRYR